MNRLTLTNAGINSGNPVILLGSTFGYKWDNLTKDFPLPGMYSGITSVEYKGWKNPGINISFYIELSNTRTYFNDDTQMQETYGAPTVGAITWSQLNSIVKDRVNKTYLSLTFGDNDTPFTSYASTASDSTSGVILIPIQIISYNLMIDPNVTDKLFITLTCMETI